MAGAPGSVVGLCAFTHDSSAVLVIDGHLVGFAEEDRLSGQKHTRAFPEATVAWLLGQAGLTGREVRVVAYNFDGRRYLGALGQLPRHLLDATVRQRALPRARSFASVHRSYRRRWRELMHRFPSARVVGVPHHRAHGLYAFASSGFDRAAVLVIDSLGELQTTTIAGAERMPDGGCRYRLRAEINDPISLGYVYGAVTEHLGWRRGDGEGTVMALAAHGEPARFRELFNRALHLTQDGFDVDLSLFPLRVLSSRYPRLSPMFVSATCAPRPPSEPVEQIHADVAAALQERTEQVVLHLARQARRITGARRLCLAGGVAMNGHQ